MGRRVLASLAGVVIASAMFVLPAGAQEISSAPTGTVVVLIDLSGSLTEADVAQEIRAAGIMNTVPGIDLYVVGFASDGSLPATVVVCQPGDELATCTQGLARRSNAQGNDTDHAAALQAAADILGPADGSGTAPRVVLLLTDGVYDPSGSGNPTEGELAALSNALEDLRSANVSVWPLGFGGAVIDELDALAIAAPGTCREPRGIIVKRSKQVPGAVNKIIGQASCASEPESERLSVAPDTELVVVTYAENELPQGTVTIRTAARERETFTCSFDDVAAVWTCEIPTENLSTGTWRITPQPAQFPVPYQQTATASAPTTTVPEVSTTTTPDQPTTTTLATTTTSRPLATTVVAQPPDVPEADSGIPWMLIVVGIVGVGIVGGVLVWGRQSR